MSRISTPSGLGVNPNVPMADMQAPTIVYGAEGMDETALLQYEQLTNVLQAGVQAAGTFLEFTKDAAKTARQNEINRFEVGLSEAKRKSAEFAEQGRDSLQPVKEFLSSYDYDSSIDEIKIALNAEWGQISEFNLETEQRRAKAIQDNNSDIMSFQFTTMMNRITDRFYELPPEEQHYLMNISSDPEALLGFVESRFSEEDKRIWASITEVNRDKLQNTLADNVNGFMNRLGTIRKDMVKIENSKKLDQLNQVRAARILGFLSGYDVQPENYVETSVTIDGEFSSYAETARTVDPTLSQDKIRKGWTNVMREVAIQAEAYGSPEMVANLRTQLLNDGNVDPATKNTIINSLDSAITKGITERYKPTIQAAVEAGDIETLDMARGMVSIDRLVTDGQRFEFTQMINAGYRAIAKKNIDMDMDDREATFMAIADTGVLPMYVGGRIVPYPSSLIPPVRMEEAFRTSLLESFPKNVTVNGQGQRVGESPYEVPNLFYAIDERVRKFRSRMDAKLGTESEIRVTSMKQGFITAARNGNMDPQGLVERVNNLPQDERAKVLKGMNDWFRTEYTKELKSALMAKYRLTEWDAKVRTQGHEMALAELTAMEMYWGMNTGFDDVGQGIRNFLWAGLQGQIEEAGTSEYLRKALLVLNTNMDRNEMMKMFGSGDTGDQMLRILEEVNIAVMNGADRDEAFKDASQRYRLDPSRTRPISVVNQEDMKALEIRLEEIMTDKLETGTMIEDASPVIRQVFYQAAIMQVPTAATIEDRIRAGEEAVESQLVFVDNSVFPVREMSMLENGPSYATAAARLLTGMDDATLVVVDVQNGEYVYALRSAQGNSVATKEIPELPELSGKRTFRMLEIKENEKLRELIVQEIPKIIERQEARMEEWRQQNPPGTYSVEERLQGESAQRFAPFSLLFGESPTEKMRRGGYRNSQ